MLLTQTTTPEDVKALDRAELPLLCGEIRHAILESSAAVGGHVAPNLGVVELTVALHRVFNSPTDKIVFDVSHQTYAHKALTGRAYTYIDPERFGEASGFANPDESEHDLFAMGHTSTSVSLGCGMAHARDLAGDTYNVITIIGDGSLSGGLAFEGLDNAAELDSNLIIIVNDNDQSIAENHGGLYRNLAELRATNGTAERNVFRALGLDYRYLDSGNDVLALVDTLQELRDIDHPIVLHISTAKGKGFEPAQSDPERWHHVGPFDMATGRKLCPGHPSEPAPRTYADITGEALSAAIKHDPQVVGITAATPYIMGFTPELRAAAGKQFVDVGIAEEHAVTFATALARSGAKPVFGVYGTFLQRAYDQIIHDAALLNLHVVFAVDRAGMVGADGETHHGIFDAAFLSEIPNMTVLCPSNFAELRTMLDRAVNEIKGPVAIRYPRGGEGAYRADSGRQNLVELREGTDLTLCAYGTMINNVLEAAELLEERGISARVVKINAISPLYDRDMREIVGRTRALLVAEECAGVGCMGQRMAAILEWNRIAPERLELCNLGKMFPAQGTVGELQREFGLDAESLANKAAEVLQ